MHNQKWEMYESWDLEIPKMPERSELYHLEPIGIGTPYVESLTSYIGRLAETHGVRTGTLITQVIIKKLHHKKYLLDYYESSNRSHIYSHAKGIIGMREYASEMVTVFEDLTLREDVRFLTLINLSDIIGLKKLIKSHRAWCPVCLNKMVTENKIVYEPLLWSIEVVSFCAKHKIQLEKSCPNCQQKNILLSPNFRPGYCSRCYYWLGIDGDNSIHTVKNEVLEQELWLSNNIGELISVSPIILGRLATEKIIVLLNRLKVENNCSERGLCRALDLTYSILRGYRNGGKLSINSLVKISFYLNVSIKQIINDEEYKSKIKENESLLLKKITKKSKREKIDLTKVRERLEDILNTDQSPPLSMAKTAKEIGFSRTSLNNHFPDLCKEISVKFLAFKKASGNRRINGLRKKVREATIELHKKGIYPGLRKVRRYLDKDTTIMHRLLLKEWRDTKESLGLK